MNKFVLDASALLALLFKEDGQERVLQVLEHEESFVSIVNYTEVLTKLILARIPMDKSLEALQKLQLEVIPLSEEIARISAASALTTYPLGFSMGDRICLATASHHHAVALTADREWKKYKGSVQVELIR